MYPLPLSPALHRLGSESMPRKELFARPADVPPMADHARRARQALEHHRAVAFCDDAAVEQHHRPRVALAPDQPAEALFELERRVGNEIVGEAVQAARLESLEPRRGERLARHGTSTPSQNESVPKRIPEPASRKRRSSWSRCPSPCTNSGQRPPIESRTASAARFSAPWLVNSTNMPPSDTCASSTSARATARSWPASSSRGSGRSVGMPNRHCDGKSKGEAWISRAFTREGGRSSPSRSSR